MVLSEAQLQTWSNKGTVTKSINAHESIRTALMADDSPVKGRNIDFYLQGSYKNDTNVRKDSDVDVVVQLNDVFYHDISNLSAEQQALFKASYSGATYNYWDFRADVLKALTDYFGSDKVKAGNKSFKLTGDSNRVNADVVPCLQFRKYKRFLNSTDQDFVEGMLFFTQSEKREIINYPKIHYKNGCRKNSPEQTTGWFKETVRVLKNARSKLVDDCKISANISPSYFIECLTYNVPNSKFGKNWQSTYYSVLNWLAEADFTNFVSQNEQTWLFGDTPEQWRVKNAQTLVKELLELE
ncbi:MAG: nucleotidyltransferase [Candidatus Bathyarchaeota archaeon]|nr:nucleotidyltransferase [Candidatus Bathyarchaeota archaeon]